MHHVNKIYERDDRNEIIPVICKGKELKGVLDGGAGVSIITEQCWEKIGKSVLTATRLKIKLGDGKVAIPLGLIKDLRIKIHKFLYYPIVGSHGF